METNAIITCNHTILSISTKDYPKSIGELATHTHTRGTMNITGEFTACDNGGREYPTGAFADVKVWGNTISSGSGCYDIRFGFDAAKSWTGETSEIGNNVPHNTLQPYISIFIYKRIK